MTQVHFYPRYRLSSASNNKLFKIEKRLITVTESNEKRPELAWKGERARDKYYSFKTSME